MPTLLPVTVSGPTWDAAKSKWKWVVSPNYSIIPDYGPTPGCRRYAHWPIYSTNVPEYDVEPARTDPINQPDAPMGPYTVWVPPRTPSTPRSTTINFVATNCDYTGEDWPWQSEEPTFIAPCVQTQVTWGTPTWNFDTLRWDYVVTATPLGGVGPYSYAWSGGGTESTKVYSLAIGESQTATCTITQTSDGCEDEGYASQTAPSHEPQYYCVLGTEGYQYCVIQTNGLPPSGGTVISYTGPYDYIEDCSEVCGGGSGPTSGTSSGDSGASGPSGESGGSSGSLPPIVPGCPPGWTLITVPGGGWICQRVVGGSSGESGNPSSGNPPSCPDGGTYNPETGMCELTPQCPSGYHYTPEGCVLNESGNSGGSSSGSSGDSGASGSSGGSSGTSSSGESGNESGYSGSGNSGSGPTSGSGPSGAISGPSGSGVPCPVPVAPGLPEVTLVVHELNDEVAVSIDGTELTSGNEYFLLRVPLNASGFAIGEAVLRDSWFQSGVIDYDYSETINRTSTRQYFGYFLRARNVCGFSANGDQENIVVLELGAVPSGSESGASGTDSGTSGDISGESSGGSTGSGPSGSSGVISGDSGNSASGSSNSGGSDSGGSDSGSGVFTCQIDVTIDVPAADTSLFNEVEIRFSLEDPNEISQEPCVTSDIDCAMDDPFIKIWLGEYLLFDQRSVGASVGELTLLDGTPRNGNYRYRFDSLDYSNGSRTIRISAQGVGCCVSEASRNYVIANTLQNGVSYRDFYAKPPRVGLVVSDALAGVEVRALEENTSRRWFTQYGFRSGTELDGNPYLDADWPKHQLLTLYPEQHQSAQGARIERTQWNSEIVPLRAPLSRFLRLRERRVPVYNLVTHDTNSEMVRKIRQIESGRHYVLTHNPARVWVYEEDNLTLYADFAVEPSPIISSGDSGNDFDWVDEDGLGIYAPNAIDAAYFKSEATGTKIFVVTPRTSDYPLGDVFAFDPDTNEQPLTYRVRGEKRIPRYVEVIGAKAIVIYAHDQSDELPDGTNHTRAYDVSFGAPKKVWELSRTVTFTTVADGKLLVGCGRRLYISNDGLTAPVLEFAFPAVVSAATTNYVGLDNGQIWRKLSMGWVMVLDRTGGIGGVVAWHGGMQGETTAEPSRALAGGTGTTLSGERTNGSWFAERQLSIPLDLATKSVEYVSAMELYSVLIESDESGGQVEDAAPDEYDERILIGTGASNGGLFFVYQRSALKDVPLVSSEIAYRILPFSRPVTTE